MKRFNDKMNDNEIRFLGSRAPERQESTPPAPRRNNNWLWALLAIVLLVVAVVIYVTCRGEEADKEEIQIQNAEEITETTITESSKSSVTVEHDSINDVKLVVYTPIGCKPELYVGRLDTTDTSIMLAAQAADYGSDWSLICAVVKDGELLSRGVAKAGFCAIFGDTITMGVSKETPIFERALNEKGSFFRQFPLVHDSIMVEDNGYTYKGKANRKALCHYKGSICIIASETKESLHDFAQALQDYKVQEALYLVGGEALTAVQQTPGVVEWIGSMSYNGLNIKDNDNFSMIVFRKK